MEDLLRIRARLPRPAGLELCARLLADRPYWDIELDDDGLGFTIPLIHGRVDEELTILEEGCRNVERMRSGLDIELDVGRSQERPSLPSPNALGPWRLIQADPGDWPEAIEPQPGPGSGKAPPASQSPMIGAQIFPGRPETGNSPSPANKMLILPPTFAFSRRQWAGEALLLTALADHLTPPPGAPETRGKAALIMESILPLAPLAAHQAGAGSISLITDEQSSPALFDLMSLNHIDAETVECLTLPFKSLSRRREDWLGHFGLIAIHLSPYICARRLKSLAGWLHPEGAIIIGGFAPGPQTAQLLRSAARAGLELAYSVNDGDWAAMKLRLIPVREALPPLTGTVVPDLVDLPPEEKDKKPEEEALDDFSPGDEPEEVYEEDSLLVEDEDDDE